MSHEHKLMIFGPLGCAQTLCLSPSRPGKYPGAVTFPIRCGRSLSAATAPGGAAYQLPIMALLVDFGPGRPERLSLGYRDLRTLLHELGHCCHNLASRTRYQHLWGTRWGGGPGGQHSPDPLAHPRQQEALIHSQFRR